MSLSCADCGLPYASDKWCDCVVSDEVWSKIEMGRPCVLCFNCMAGRLVALGMEKVSVTIRSGPFLLAWDDEGQRADLTALQETLALVGKRLGELNRDDEAGVRIVIANALGG